MLPAISPEINFFDHGVQLTRNFKVLKLYMSLKTFGLNAFKQAVQYNINLAEKVEAMLRKSEKWEIISPATLAVINFRYNPHDAHFSEKQIDSINQTISEQIIASGEALLTTTVLQKQIVIRMCLINPRTTIEDVKETIQACESIAESLT